MIRERRAFWCEKCLPPVRKFLLEEDEVPVCPVHGSFVRQENRPYAGPPVPKGGKS